MFGTPIVCRSIQHCLLMIDSMQGSPVLHGFGNEFAIVADEYFKVVSRLVFNNAVLQLENGSCLLFVSQGKTLGV